MAEINGGYYIKARKIQESEIAHSPPHFREIWDWFLRKANHKDRVINGKIIKRGQYLCTYNDILEGLHWKVGWRKCKYTKSGCENAMKFLRSRSMIATTRTTRGFIVTVLNYNKYQSQKNYESHSESHSEKGMVPQDRHTINKNVKNGKEVKELSAFPKKAGDSKPFYLTKKKKKLTGWKLECFELFWKAFHWPKGKAEASDAWLQIPGLTENLANEEIIPAAICEADNRQAILDRGSTPKWAQGWLSSRRWEDELPLRSKESGIKCRKCKRVVNTLISGLCLECKEKEDFK